MLLLDYYIGMIAPCQQVGLLLMSHTTQQAYVVVNSIRVLIVHFIVHDFGCQHVAITIIIIKQYYCLPNT